MTPDPEQAAASPATPRTVRPGGGSRRPRVSVVGAGVIGLTCAVRLAEAGYEVDVLARDLPLETTSAVAGGHWMPFLADPPDAVERWSRRTFEQLRLISELPGSGVAMRSGYLVGTADRPDWAVRMADLVPLTPVVNPAPGRSSGWQATVPMADMPVYLTFLIRRLAAAGGTLTRLPLVALPARGLVINCSGLAAGSLASDSGMQPIRGQVLTMTNPGLTTWYTDTNSDPSAPTYVFPHPGRVVVGGTVEPGNWSTEPDPAVATQILRRGTELVPQLAAARVLSHRVGLRPARPVVRLETVRGPEGVIVHCYGHGGSGITLSWGCADEVLDEVGALSVEHSAAS